MNLGIRLFALVVPILLAPACGGDSATGDEQSGARAAAGRDRGAASMLLGGEPWNADSGKARMQRSRLFIDLVRSERVAGLTRRSQVKFSIGDYSGPGTYTLDHGSTFVAVTVDMRSVSGTISSGNDAESNGGERREGAEQGNTMFMLSGGEVVIAAASESAIEGTFRWAPSAGGTSSGRELSNGEFRAVLK